jgi:hypothetical protein
MAITFMGLAASQFNPTDQLALQESHNTRQGISESPRQLGTRNMNLDVPIRMV